MDGKPLGPNKGIAFGTSDQTDDGCPDGHNDGNMLGISDGNEVGSFDGIALTIPNGTSLGNILG